MEVYRRPGEQTQLSGSAYLALKLSLEPYPSCTVGMGALWNRLLFADQRWPGGQQHDEVSWTMLALAEV